MHSDEEYAAMRFTAPRPHGKSPLKLPPPNLGYYYGAYRLVSFWPETNGNNATFFEDDMASLLKGDDDQGLDGKLVNTWHSLGEQAEQEGKSPQVIGSVFEHKLLPGVGIDTSFRFDRRLTTHYSITPEDMRPGEEYSACSIEVKCDRKKSRFIAILDEHSGKLDDQKIFTAEEAEEHGIRRTYPNESEPYLYQGKYRVVEVVKPTLFLGAGLMDRPADKTAEIFDLAASKGAEAPPGTGEERSAFAETDIPVWGAEDPFADIRSNYNDDDSEYSEMDDETRNGLPNEAFAAVYPSEDAHTTVRKLPLYDSAESVKDGKPNKGHVKAALEALTHGFRGQKVDLPSNVRAEAIKKVRSAHDKVFPKGDKQVDNTEMSAKIGTLETDLADTKAAIANFKTKEDELATQLQSKDDTIAAQEKQIGDLQAIVGERDTEISSLKEASNKREAEEKASLRLAELEKIGLTVKDDEEKATLLTALASEDDMAFKLRTRDIEIAQLRAGKPVVDENNDEHASLLAQKNLDLGAAVTNGKPDIYSIL